MLSLSNNADINSDDINLELAKDISSFYANPLGFVLYAFPWGEGTLKNFNGPDKWQIEFLKKLGQRVKERNFDGITPVNPILQSVSSGHGVGKSTLVAWIILWIMSTRPYCKGTVTANTSNQLNSKTWPELGKWYNNCINKHWFNYKNGKGNMCIYSIGNKETWRCDALTCNEENSEAFAGQHAANSTSFYIFDEASAIPDKIWEVSEGGLTDGEPMHLAFGNPTRNYGRFKETFRKLRHRWDNTIVDSRNVAITNKKQLNAWVEDYGIDSDFVKVRIRGLFPSQNTHQFIGEEIVQGAYGKFINENSFKHMPSIIGVDPAWSGADNFAIVHRKGNFCEVLEVFPKNDNDCLAAQKIALHQDRLNAKAVFIDQGYGTGVYSTGKTMGRSWQLISFASKSPDSGYVNMRAYMWGKMRQWLIDGGTIPQNETLARELQTPESINNEKGIQLESKTHMEQRGQGSPDIADALALTFAFPVPIDYISHKVQRAKSDFDSYAYQGYDG